MSSKQSTDNSTRRKRTMKRWRTKKVMISGEHDFIVLSKKLPFVGFDLGVALFTWWKKINLSIYGIKRNKPLYIGKQHDMHSSGDYYVYKHSFLVILISNANQRWISMFLKEFPALGEVQRRTTYSGQHSRNASVLKENQKYRGRTLWNISTSMLRPSIGLPFKASLAFAASSAVCMVTNPNPCSKWPY